MPSEGDWEAPIYGEIGLLRRVGDTVECHACGESFAALSGHLLARHDLTGAEYKAIFGLKVLTGLVGTRTAARLSAAIKSAIADGRIITIDQRPEDRATPEQMSAASRGRRRRAEELAADASPERQAARAVAAAEQSRRLGGKKTRTCAVCGIAQQRYWAKRGKTCGAPRCRSVVLSRGLAGKAKSPEANRKLSETRKLMIADGRLVRRDDGRYVLA